MSGWSAFLGAFDYKKIAFVDYVNIQDIFYLNDFNWNVTPSNHVTKEFQLIKKRIETTLKQNTYVYDYEKDEKELQAFIKNNVAKATTTSKLKIDKNNFILDTTDTFCLSCKIFYQDIFKNDNFFVLFSHKVAKLQKRAT